MENPYSIIGIDFSGAALAGEKIWIAESSVEAESLKIQRLERLADLPNSSPDRNEALPALVQRLKTFERACVGFDFPFALQKSNLKPNQSWRDWILSLSQQFDNADQFRAAYADDKRKTEIEAKTPFSPLNLRLYRQTFHGQRDVLAPLLAGGAKAVPFEEASEGLTLLEICPASLLKREKLYLSYKGKSETQLLNREAILSGISEKYCVEISDDIRLKAVENSEGDALDAILAAICVFKTKDFSAQSALDTLEGRVYF
jgi:hypothetical protein